MKKYLYLSFMLTLMSMVHARTDTQQYHQGHKISKKNKHHYPIQIAHRSSVCSDDDQSFNNHPLDLEQLARRYPRKCHRRYNDCLQAQDPFGYPAKVHAGTY